LVSSVKECEPEFGDDLRKGKECFRRDGSSIVDVGVEKSDAHTVKLYRNDQRRTLEILARQTYSRKLWYDNSEGCHEVDHEIGDVVMRVVSADKEKNNGNAEQELFGGSILVAAIDLLPHVEVVVSTGVEFEGHTSHPVEHEE
jgi:hypothetical protein